MKKISEYNTNRISTREELIINKGCSLFKFKTYQYIQQKTSIILNVTMIYFIISYHYRNLARIINNKNLKLGQNLTMEVCRKNLDWPIFASIYSDCDFSFQALDFTRYWWSCSLRVICFPTVKTSVHFQIRRFLKENKVIWDRCRSVSRKWNLYSAMPACFFNDTFIWGALLWLITSVVVI